MEEDGEPLESQSGCGPARKLKWPTSGTGNRWLVSRSDVSRLSVDLLADESSRPRLSSEVVAGRPAGHLLALSSGASRRRECLANFRLLRVDPHSTCCRPIPTDDDEGDGQQVEVRKLNMKITASQPMIALAAGWRRPAARAGQVVVGVVVLASESICALRAG